MKCYYVSNANKGLYVYINNKKKQYMSTKNKINFFTVKDRLKVIGKKKKDTLNSRLYSPS